MRLYVKVVACLTIILIITPADFNYYTSGCKSEQMFGIIIIIIIVIVILILILIIIIQGNFNKATSKLFFEQRFDPDTRAFFRQMTEVNTFTTVYMCLVWVYMLTLLC